MNARCAIAMSASSAWQLRMVVGYNLPNVSRDTHGNYGVNGFTVICDGRSFLCLLGFWTENPLPRVGQQHVTCCLAVCLSLRGRFLPATHFTAQACQGRRHFNRRTILPPSFIHLGNHSGPPQHSVVVAAALTIICHNGKDGF